MADIPYLIVSYPVCSGCYREVEHDDSFYCERCGVMWDDGAGDGATATMDLDGNFLAVNRPAESGEASR